MNKGDGTFSDRAKEAGIEPPPGGIFLEERIGSQRATRGSRCAAVADFDSDGRLDLMVSNFNDRPYYFKNEFPRKNYVAFRLQGNHQSYFSPDSRRPAKSCRDAIGALVRIYHGKDVQVRQLQAAGGYLSQCSSSIHFGLGDWPEIDRAEIRWPSGRIQVIRRPEINRRHQLIEPN
jgi:hypothetical protein